MKEGCKGNWTGTGLILAGEIVFLVGLTIIIFKELNIPRHWILAAAGLVLIAAGFIVHSIKRVCGQRDT